MVRTPRARAAGAAPNIVRASASVTSRCSEGGVPMNTASTSELSTISRHAVDTRGIPNFSATHPPLCCERLAIAVTSASAA